VNRAQRRRVARGDLQVHWLVAQAICDRCGAPMCPQCGEETSRCECCGEDSCERCGVYVTPPVRRANSR
jgi:hypothetical protein